MRSNPLHTLRDRRRSDEGFTLIELLVVVVILGILIGIAIPVYLNYRKSANDKAAQSDLRSAINTLEACNSETGYPATPTSNTFINAAVPCTGQSISLTSGTTLTYFAKSDLTSYIATATNSGGTRFYCYASKAGGSINSTRTAAPAAYADAC